MRIQRQVRLSSLIRFVYLTIITSCFYSIYWISHERRRIQELKREMARPQSRIPRIIHQSWKTKELPIKFQFWSNSWKINHPEWEYRLWTDEDNEKLVRTHFKWFQFTYDRFERFICKVDSVRYMYMYLYGGVYADLDMESIRPIDSVLENAEMALGYMNVPSSSISDWEHSLPNAWLASRPGHSFWLFLLSEIMINTVNQAYLGVEELTGPVAVHRAYMKYMTLSPALQDPVTLLPHDVIYPYNWYLFPIFIT